MIDINFVCLSHNYRPFGQSLAPLLNSLSANPNGTGIPVLPSLDRLQVDRPPSPGAVELERAIEDARRDSLKLEERRNTILEKVEKLEKKKAKKQQLHKDGSSSPSTSRSSASASSSVTKMADAAAAAAAECLDAEEQESKTPREPPIVYKGIPLSFLGTVLEEILLCVYLYSLCLSGETVGPESCLRIFLILFDSVLKDERALRLGRTYPTSTKILVSFHVAKISGPFV